MTPCGERWRDALAQNGGTHKRAQRLNIKHVYEGTSSLLRGFKKSLPEDEAPHGETKLLHEEYHARAGKLDAGRVGSLMLST